MADLIIVLIVLNFIFLTFYLGIRIYFLMFHQYCNLNLPPQKPQWDRNHQKIITSDGYSLDYRSKYFADNQYFFITFHGLLGNKSHFDFFTEFAEKKHYSYLIFNQRSFGINKRSAPNFDVRRNLLDCAEIIKLVNKTYPQSKIILLGHSFGCTLITNLINKYGIKNLIAGCVLIGLVNKTTFQLGKTIFIKKQFEPTHRLMISLANLHRVLYGSLFRSQTMIHLRNNSLFKLAPQSLNLTPLIVKIPIFFFCQVFLHNLFLIQKIKKLPKKLPVLILWSPADELSNDLKLQRQVKRFYSHFEQIQTTGVEDMNHLFFYSYDRFNRVNQIISKWIAVTNFTDSI